MRVRVRLPYCRLESAFNAALPDAAAVFHTSILRCRWCSVAQLPVVNGALVGNWGVEPAQAASVARPDVLRAHWTRDAIHVPTCSHATFSRCKCQAQLACEACEDAPVEVLLVALTTDVVRKLSQTTGNRVPRPVLPAGVGCVAVIGPAPSFRGQAVAPGKFFKQRGRVAEENATFIPRAGFTMENGNRRVGDESVNDAESAGSNVTQCLWCI